jgi:fluoride exporter
MLKLACIAIGGATGALLRFGLGGWVQKFTSASFPWGTLSVNLLGSLAIGVLWGSFEQATVSPHVRALLLTGLLGAFTTFSTFSLESIHLLEDRQYALAGANVVGSCLAGLALVWAGLVLARSVLAAGE